MANIAHPIMNGLRDLMMPAENARKREEMKTSLQLIKTIALVTVAVSAIIFIAIPKILTLLILLPIGYAAYEISTMAGNAHEILDNFVVELFARWDEENMIKQITKNAPLAQFLIRHMQEATREHPIAPLPVRHDLWR